MAFESATEIILNPKFGYSGATSFCGSHRGHQVGLIFQCVEKRCEQKVALYCNAKLCSTRKYTRGVSEDPKKPLSWKENETLVFSVSQSSQALPMIDYRKTPIGTSKLLQRIFNHYWSEAVSGIQVARSIPELLLATKYIEGKPRDAQTLANAFKLMRNGNFTKRAEKYIHNELVREALIAIYKCGNIFTHFQIDAEEEREADLILDQTLRLLPFTFRNFDDDEHCESIEITTDEESALNHLKDFASQDSRSAREADCEFTNLV